MLSYKEILEILWKEKKLILDFIADGRMPSQEEMGMIKILNKLINEINELRKTDD